MLKPFTRYIIIVYCCFCFSSCDESSGVDDSFKCKMNGSSWSSISSNCDLFHVEACNGGNNMEIVATGERGRKFIIEIQTYSENNCIECIPEGIYYIDEDQNICGQDTACSEVIINYELASGQQFRPRDDKEDFVEITNCNPELHTISGTFSFTLYDFDTGDIEYSVTDGEFEDIEFDVSYVQIIE